MNAPLHPEMLLRAAGPPREALPPASAGELREVWESRWGTMLIEVVAGQVFVNGQRVERHAAAADDSG